MCCVLWASPAVWIHDSGARSAGSLKIAWVRDEARWIGLRAGESGTVDSGHRENVVNLRYSQYAATPVPDHITLSVDTILQWMVANRNLVNRYRYAVQCRVLKIAVVKLRPTMQCVGPGHCCRYSVSMRGQRRWSSGPADLNGAANKIAPDLPSDCSSSHPIQTGSSSLALTRTPGCGT